MWALQEWLVFQKDFNFLLFDFKCDVMLEREEMLLRVIGSQNWRELSVEGAQRGLQLKIELNGLELNLK